MAGLYIHIPYCKKLCHYCDFYHVIPHGDTSSFFMALEKEIILKENYLGDEPVSTIYFGGGTPSSVEKVYIKKLLETIRRVYKITDDCEITFEMNPDDVSSDYLSFLTDNGINRGSLGVQSWRDADLRFLNRRHNSAGAHKALELLSRSAIKNISIDLIYGIPGLKSADWSANLDITFGHDIRHLSAYHLTIEQGTVFGKMLSRGSITEIEEEESTAQFNLLIEKADKAGFIHYEISNFALAGYISKHNSNYWKMVPYIGVGPSAHSYNRHSRQWNISNVKKYTELVTDGERYYETEELDERKRFNEYVMTSLRTIWGIDLNYIERTFEREACDYLISISSRFREYGMMKLENNTLVLTNQGKMISDNIISDFMMPSEE